MDRYSRRMTTPSARLEVVAGNAAGAVIMVHDELLIGRHAAGAGRLADDEEISRSHARVSLEPHGLCAIEDLGSTNGTFVNGLRIAGPKTLAVGDTIELGGTTLLVAELTFADAQAASERRDSQTTPRVARAASTPSISVDEAVGTVTVKVSPDPDEPDEPDGAPTPPEVATAPTPPRLSLQLEVDFAAGEATIKLTGDSDAVRLGFDGDVWRVQPPGS
jgi:pSer/pThr/pTyr-binding forkhead associated (FHA) protein